MSTRSQRLGKYELHERLGYGGMAEVWKAYDTQLRRFVAIKILHPDLRADPQFITRFKREAQLVASLHHPNIVSIYDFRTIFFPPESEHKTACMVMDYVEGQTLEDYMHLTSHKGTLPSTDEILHIFRPICDAIDYAHHEGMIHRDIKPANILLDKRVSKGSRRLQNSIGEPVLSDFGIAKLMGTSDSTLTGGIIGTPRYISPEQAQGRPGNEQSDVYSLGVILYEMFTGVSPFQGNNPLGIIRQHIEVLPTPPHLVNPDISPAVSTVIMRCLAKNPEMRFSNATAMVTALEDELSTSFSENSETYVYESNTMNEPTYVKATPSNVIRESLPQTGSSRFIPTGTQTQWSSPHINMLFWRSRKNLLITLGSIVTVLIILASLLFFVGQGKYNDIVYGYPRTFQTDAVVGHNDSTQHPSHFIALNLHGQVIVVEFPGGNPARSYVYLGPDMIANGDDLLPITLTFSDVNHNGKPDMIIHIQGRTFTFCNDGLKFMACSSSYEVNPNLLRLLYATR